MKVSDASDVLALYGASGCLVLPRKLRVYGTGTKNTHLYLWVRILVVGLASSW